MTTHMFMPTRQRKRPKPLPTLSYSFIASVLASPLSHGGIFDDPHLGEAVRLAVWHKPLAPTFRFKILRDRQEVVSGSVDDVRLAVVEFAHVSQAYRRELDAPVVNNN